MDHSNIILNTNDISDLLSGEKITKKDKLLNKTVTLSYDSPLIDSKTRKKNNRRADYFIYSLYSLVLFFNIGGFFMPGARYYNHIVYIWSIIFVTAVMICRKKYPGMLKLLFGIYVAVVVPILIVIIFNCYYHFL